MAKVKMTVDLEAAPDDVWKLIGGFNALPDWHPAVEKSELEEEGQTRKLSLAGGGTIIEKLIKKSDQERLYSYSIENSPLPVSNYTATISVREENGNTQVEWSSEFTPMGVPENDAVDVIKGIYQAGFDNLNKLFGK